jgi:hypothetical protein
LKARGRTKIILKKLGKIQDLVGKAQGLHLNDQDLNGFAKAQAMLKEAFELCLEARGLYDPIEE